MDINFDFFSALAAMKAAAPEPGPTPPSAPPGPPHAEAKASPAPPAPAAIGPDGVRLIQRFESCGHPRGDGSFIAYPDPGTGGPPWTIGWGSTGPDIHPGTVWSQAECDARLVRDLVRFAADVSAAIAGSPTTQPQFDALTAFHYNTGAIRRATLTRLHRAGQWQAAATEFAKWTRAGGKVLPGLVRRRAAEAALYLSALPAG